MNGTEIGSLKAFLLAQKSSILNKSQEFKTQQLSADGNVIDEAEVASRDFTMSVSIHLHERDRAALVQIERALAKIEAGVFGQCESCSQSIGDKRLAARPFAALCIECMEEQEDPRNYLN